MRALGHTHSSALLLAQILPYCARMTINNIRQQNKALTSHKDSSSTVYLSYHLLNGISCKLIAEFRNLNALNFTAMRKYLRQE